MSMEPNPHSSPLGVRADKPQRGPSFRPHCQRCPLNPSGPQRLNLCRRDHYIGTFCQFQEWGCSAPHPLPTAASELLESRKGWTSCSSPAFYQQPQGPSETLRTWICLRMELGIRESTSSFRAESRGQPTGRALECRWGEAKSQRSHTAYHVVLYSCKEWVGNQAISFMAAQMGKQPDLKVTANAFALLPRSIQGNPGDFGIVTWYFFGWGFEMDREEKDPPYHGDKINI